MKGLLLKDLFMLKRYSRTLLVLIVFYAVLGMMNDETSVMVGMMCGITVLLCMMMVVSSIAMDDQCKWNGYALAMPVSHSKLVGAKYVLALVLGLLGTLAAGVLCILLVAVKGGLDAEGMLEIAATIGILLLTGTVYIAVMMPFVYKFGVEKSRILMIALVLLPTGMAYLLKHMGVPLPAPGTLELLLKLSPVVVLALYAGSFWLSLHIVRNKEF